MCYLVAKNINDIGSIAWKTTHGKHLAEFKSLLEEKNFLDVRDVIKLRNNLKELKSRLNDDIQVSLEGHKIACL